MKKLRISHVLSFCVFSIFLIIPFLSNAAVVKLAWDPNTEQDLAGYKVYYGYASGNYDASIDVGKTTTFQVTGLEYDQTYYFAVTAYDTSGLGSDYSDEISYIIPKSDSDPDSRPLSPYIKTGEVSVDHNWKRVEFNDPFIDPVVVAKPLSHNEIDPAVVRIKDVDSTGFDIRIQE